jgi:flagellar basal-body rod protein FlgG
MDGIELMASAMHAAQARLDVAAGNVANVSTDGFARRVVHASLTERGIVASVAQDAAQPPLRHTGRNFDLCAVGGNLVVLGPSGALAEIRSAAFERTADGRLIDGGGRALLGRAGPLHVPPDAEIDARGEVRAGGTLVDTLRTTPRAEVQSGFLPGSSVDAVHEMVDLIGAQRAFETAQKTLSAIDDVRAKDASDLARIKG